jgi:hypothetical protein
MWGLNPVIIGGSCHILIVGQQFIIWEYVIINLLVLQDWWPYCKLGIVVLSLKKVQCLASWTMHKLSGLAFCC